MKKVLPLLTLFLCSFFISFSQVQVGNSVNGAAAGDGTTKTALSADGKRMAVSSILNDDSGTDLGHVRVFELIGNEWIQLGSNILGEGVPQTWFGMSISLSADGNRLAVGTIINTYPGPGYESVRVYEYGQGNWNLLGNNIYDDQAISSFGGAVSLSADGNIVAVGASRGEGGSSGGNVWIFQYNGTSWVQMGNEIGADDDDDEFGTAVSLSSDGQRLVVGASGYTGPPPQNYSRGKVYVFDYDGNNWVQIGDNPEGTQGYSQFGYVVDISSDGSRIFVGAPYWSVQRGQISAYELVGNEWIQLGSYITGSNEDDYLGISISASGDGSRFIVGGEGIDSPLLNAGKGKIYAYENGEWEALTPDVNGEDTYNYLGSSVSMSEDGKIVAISSPGNDNEAGTNAGKVDVFQLSGVMGQIYNDINEDCILSSEFGIASRKAIIQPGNIIIETGNNGFWGINSLATGTYTITVDTTGSWNLTCPITQSFTVTNPEGITVAPNFGFVSTEPCAAPDVSIHMPFIRRCFTDQRIYIQACNTPYATGILTDPYVIVELDSLFTPSNSSIPYVSLGNHQYQIDLSTLNPGDCENFWIEADLSCDASLEQGLCMEVNLFPAEPCVFDSIPNPFPSDVLPCTSEWDESSLSVEGYCENDSVHFIITNLGIGDMTCFSPVRIFINGNLIILDSIQLISGGSTSFSFSGDGQSWRLETDQHPLHPGNSQPNATVEGCGGENVASRINAHYLDDADPIIDIFCGIVTGSYDPNDKTGYPLGVTDMNKILPNQKMEYVIRFQNTGTDTAFTVVIRDTLETDFDIFSVQSGVSSHAYSFKMYGPRVLEWTFDNILLPDSTTNEPGSNGFVTFKVDQNADLPEGYILENSAGIYFDFNDPIITNSTFHTIDYFTQEIITTNSIAEGCNSFISPSGNYVWTESGTYYDVIQDDEVNNVNIVDLTINTVDVSFTQVNDELVANQSGATYQWLDCNNNSTPIENATNQILIPDSYGSYAVEITYEDCIVVSDCQIFSFTGVQDNEFKSSISVYPNPTAGNFIIDFGQNYEAVSISLKDVLGKTIMVRQMKNTSRFDMEIDTAEGLYFLELETTNGKTAIFKLIKQ
ncbi:MAG: putative repeat protein (TIGR01451 family) [Maribacter sp.]|jgi:uncharacterized repeat protein (TIGR01451 family)